MTLFHPYPYIGMKVESFQLAPFDTLSFKACHKHHIYGWFDKHTLYKDHMSLQVNHLCIYCHLLFKVTPCHTFSFIFISFHQMKSFMFYSV